MVVRLAVPDGNCIISAIYGDWWRDFPFVRWPCTYRSEKTQNYLYTIPALPFASNRNIAPQRLLSQEVTLMSSGANATLHKN